jgi:hypothetical protein
MRDEDNPREGPSPLDLGYLACSLDAEGCITIKNRRPLAKKWAERFQVSVSSFNTNYTFVKFLLSTFGGHINHHRNYEKSAGRWKDEHTWEVSQTQALPVLRLVRPALKLKGRQALACIQFLEGFVDLTGVTDQEKKDQERLRRQTFCSYVQMLNAKGPPATTERVDIRKDEATV